MRNQRLVVAACAVVAASTGTALGQASIIGLGDLPGGTFLSTASGISGDGTTVTGYSRSDLGDSMFRWTQATGMVDLGDLPGGVYGSVGSGVSFDGTFIAGTGASTLGNQAFRWSSSGFTVLGDLPGGTISTVGLGISYDGSVLAGWGSATSGTGAFRWTQATGLTALPDLAGGAFNCGAKKVSGDGSTIVGWGTSALATMATRWISGGAIALTLPNGTFIESEANDVSADGSIIVGRLFTPGGPRGFRWLANTGMVDIGALPGNGATNAIAVSGDGTAMIGISSGRFFYWTEQAGMQDLVDLLSSQGVDMSSWSIELVSGLSFDGSAIVGHASRPHGTEAFIIYIPAPSSLLGIAIGTGCLVRRRRREC